jgi:hypothetical protein
MKTILGAAVVISLIAIGLAARLLTSAVPCAPKADDAPCGEAPITDVHLASSSACLGTRAFSSGFGLGGVSRVYSSCIHIASPSRNFRRARRRFLGVFMSSPIVIWKS